MSGEPLPAASISPLPARLVPFVAVRPDELCALGGCGDTLVPLFKRRSQPRGVDGPAETPWDTWGSSSPHSTQAIGSGFAGLSVGRNSPPSEAMPCGMPAAGLCLFPLFLKRQKAALMQPWHCQLRGLRQ